jgi:hypothetical protein
MTDSFQLQNDKPKPRLWKAPPTDPKRQGVLFGGLDCLPGQEDLFDVDAPVATPETIAWRRTDKPPRVVWWLGNTGYRVEQCGHPTALHPWMAYAPDGTMIWEPPNKKYAYDDVVTAKRVALDAYLKAQS